MTIDITKPLDTELARTLPGYIRETRAALEGAVTDSSAALAAVGILENDVDNLAALIAAALVKFPNQGVFVDGDATPSVSGGIIYRTANTTSTAITYLDGGFAGQMVIIVADDENTTVVHNPGYIILEGGVSITFNANQGIILVCHENSIGNKQWIQVGSIGGGSSTGNAKFNRDTFTVGVGGQSSFDTSVAFQTGQRLMFPYVNGELQPSSKFTEVDSNTITFGETLPEGTFVELVYITTLSVTTSVDDLFVVNKPYIDVRQYNSFAEAITYAANQNKVLLISRPVSIAANMTIEANLLCITGGELQIASGYNTVFDGSVTLEAGSKISTTAGDLTFNSALQINGGVVENLDAGHITSIYGPFRCGLYQCFDGAGTVTFGSGAVSEVYPEWWGADNTGATSSSDAFNAWASCGCKKLRTAERGTYKIKDVVLPATSYIDIDLGYSTFIADGSDGFPATSCFNVTFTAPSQSGSYWMHFWNFRNAVIGTGYMTDFLVVNFTNDALVTDINIKNIKNKGGRQGTAVAMNAIVKIVNNSSMTSENINISGIECNGGGSTKRIIHVTSSTPTKTITGSFSQIFQDSPDNTARVIYSDCSLSRSRFEMLYNAGGTVVELASCVNSYFDRMYQEAILAGSIVIKGSYQFCTFHNTTIIDNAADGQLFNGTMYDCKWFTCEHYRVATLAHKSITLQATSRNNIIQDMWSTYSADGHQFWTAVDDQGTNNYFGDRPVSSTHIAVITPTTSGTVTLDGAYQSMNWSRQNHIVRLSGVLRVSSVSSPVGTISISIPYTCSAGNGSGVSVAVHVTGFAAGLSSVNVMAYIDPATKAIIVQGMSSGSGIAIAQYLQTNSTIRISATYVAKSDFT